MLLSPLLYCQRQNNRQHTRSETLVLWGFLVLVGSCRFRIVQIPNHDVAVLRAREQDVPDAEQAIQQDVTRWLPDERHDYAIKPDTSFDYRTIVSSVARRRTMSSACGIESPIDEAAAPVSD